MADLVRRAVRLGGRDRKEKIRKDTQEPC